MCAFQLHISAGRQNDSAGGRLFAVAPLERTMETQRLTESLRETLAVFETAGEPLTTSEVAERLDLGRRSTYDRLDRLVEHGHLQTKKVGASARVWWRVPTATGDETTEANWPVVAQSLVSDVFDRAQVGMYVLDADDEVAWHNDAFERYFGITRAAIVGRDEETLVDELLAPAVEHPTAFAERLRDPDVETDGDGDGGSDGARSRFECHVTDGEGRSERWLEHRSEPIDSGVFAGGRVECYLDVTDRARTERAYRTQRGQFESLVDAVDEYAIFRLDADGGVQTWNEGAARLKGYGADDILGEHVSTFYTEQDREAGVPSANLRAAAEHGSVEDEGWRVRADGSRFWANVTITAIRDEEGELDGYAKVTRDMSDRRAFEQELQRERDRLEELFDALPVAAAVLDGDGVSRANDKARRFFDVSEAESGAGLTQGPVFDEDGEAVATTDLPHERALESGWPVRDWVGQFEQSDGTHQWLSLTAVPSTDSDGGVEQVIVSAEDVTQLKEQARQLRRSRDGLEHELDEVLERVDDGFFAIDDDWRFTYVNERATSMLERDRSELIGAYVWDQFPAAVETTFQERYEHAMETGESVTFEEHYAPLGVWFEVSVYPSESGLSVSFRDVTARKERERELERYRTIVEAVDEGIYVVDEEGTFTEVNDTYAAMVGREPDELMGAHVSLVVDDEETLSAASDVESDLADGETADTSLEATMTNPDGETWVGEATFSLMETEDGHERVGVVRDITERKAREQELERYEQIVETVDDGIYALDDQDRFALVNDALCDILGYERETLLGLPATEVYDEEYASVIEARASAVRAGNQDMATIELEVSRADGTLVPVETRYEPFSYGDGDIGRCGVVRDISERIERERELQRRVRQQAVVTDLGQQALEDRDLDGLMAAATEQVVTTLGCASCRLLDLNRDSDTLRVRQQYGVDSNENGSATVATVEDDSLAADTLRSTDPIVIDERSSEPGADGPDHPHETDHRSAIGVVIGPQDDPWGVLGIRDTESREFSEQDVYFVQSVAAILATAINRHDHEAMLVEQREQLAALNSLNRVVRETTDAVLEQSTRDEIERTVCERLAATDSYSFAWIGEVDETTQSVSVRTEAGIEGPLDDSPISVDPDDERGDGPTGRAIRTGTVQSIQSIESREDGGHWHAVAERYEVESAASIPISYEGTTYGVINVSAARPSAFQGQELAVLGQLGEVVGHAIAATERKQALMSDEVVELAFQVPKVFDDYDLAAPATGRFSLDHVVQIADDEFLVYGTASPEAVPTVRELLEQLPHWTDLTFTEEEGDDAPEGETTFELRLDEPPVLSTVASLGGSVERAVVEDGDYRMTLQLSTGANVRQVIEAVTAEYPSATMLRRQQVTKDSDLPRPADTLLSDLTDRQRATLQAAYHAGFFEWPRDASGEDVAESLQVSPPTFHQHLRKAEGKVFTALFDSASA